MLLPELGRDEAAENAREISSRDAAPTLEPAMGSAGSGEGTYACTFCIADRLC